MLSTKPWQFQICLKMHPNKYMWSFYRSGNGCSTSTSKQQDYWLLNWDDYLGAMFTIKRAGNLAWHVVHIVSYYVVYIILYYTIFCYSVLYYFIAYYILYSIKLFYIIYTDHCLAATTERWWTHFFVSLIGRRKECFHGVNVPFGAHLYLSTYRSPQNMYCTLL